ncbi:MAG: hypothetical protein ACOCRO_11555, partial [Halanaerobiales bacterium]
LEGIVAKEMNSAYQFKRSKYWIKIKCWQYIEVIITGYTNDHLLYVAQKDKNGNLINMGKVKVSLEKEIKDTLFSFLASIKIKEREKNQKLYSVKPVIKVMVRYTEINNNSFRHGYVIDIIT